MIYDAAFWAVMRELLGELTQNGFCQAENIDHTNGYQQNFRSGA